MQPNSKVSYDTNELKILNKTIKNVVETKRKRGKDATYATELPEFVAIKLTNRCNLRCKHCYQWNETGYNTFLKKEEQKEEIELDILQKVLQETKKAESRLYLWGGEPLLYSRFGELADMLWEDRREVSICTNGLLIRKHIDSLLKISYCIEFLIAIEGFEQEHDALRGQGMFQKTIANIKYLVELRKQGRFEGKITIHTMINDSLIPHLFNLLVYLEEIGVDMVMVCYPWYISDMTSKKMDAYFDACFSWLKNYDPDKKKSWHAFKYRLSTNSIPLLLEQIHKVKERTWKIRLRYQPDLQVNELYDFIEGRDQIGEMHPQCLGLSTRMDIGADGAVTACKQFSEFTVGNLKNRSVAEIWSCEEYRRIRDIISKETMPVCTKCNVLYLHGN